MKRVQSAFSLENEHGAPPHKQQHGEVEIWHYPLGIVGGMMYAIHVAVVGDDASQTYMFTEPSESPDTVHSRRPWWRRFLEGLMSGFLGR